MARERCAFCGALNPADAQWCGQCHRQFPPPEMERSSAPAATPEIGATAGPAASSAASPGTEEAAAGSAYRPATRGAFTVTEEGIAWKCKRCEKLNPLEAQVCSVCGTSFAEVVRPEDNRPQRDPNMAALISLFLPGAGHMYLHLWPQGIARAIVSLWVSSVVFVTVLAGGRDNTTTMAVVFGFVATALWVIGAHDAYREARGESSMAILKGKVFLYLVLGLLMLLFIMLMSAGLKAR